MLPMRQITKGSGHCAMVVTTTYVRGCTIVCRYICARMERLYYLTYIYLCHSVVHANEKFSIKFPKVFKFLESFQPKVSGKFPINTSSFQKLLEVSNQ